MGEDSKTDYKSIIFYKMTNILIMVTNNSSPYWGYVVAGILALTGMGLLLRWYRKNRKEEVSSDINVSNSSTSPTSVPHVDNEIVEVLTKKLDSFSGNFGALLNIANDAHVDLDYADVVFTNVTQVVDVQYGAKVKEWFSAFAKDRNSWDAKNYMKKAGELVALFIECGVTHATEINVVWGDKAAKRYNRVDMIDKGEPCEVVAPYWMLDGLVVEKGLLKSLKN